MTRINMTDGTGGAEQRSHQEKLACSLVESLGVEGAIHAYQANCWDGVLEYVQSIRTNTEAAGA
jgi:hypothetical protein